MTCLSTRVLDFPYIHPQPCAQLSGDLPEKLLGRFSSGLSLPVLCASLRKAALDPRVVGVCFRIEPLGLGWGKLQEIRRHIEYFNQSGKFSIAYIERGGEKEV